MPGCFIHYTTHISLQSAFIEWPSYQASIDLITCRLSQYLFALLNRLARNASAARPSHVVKGRKVASIRHDTQCLNSSCCRPCLVQHIDSGLTLCDCGFLLQVCHLTGALLCMGSLAVAALTYGKSQAGGSNPVLGDFLVLAGACCFAASNIYQASSWAHLVQACMAVRPGCSILELHHLGCGSGT